MQSMPDSGISGSQPGVSAPDQDAPASQGSAGVILSQSKAADDAAVEGIQGGSQPLQQAGASVSNACAGEIQGDVGFLQNSPWRVKRRKENSAPSSPEHLARHAQQGLFASTPAGSSLGQRAAGQLDSLPAHQDHMFSQEAAAAGRSLMAALRAAGINLRSPDAPGSSYLHPGSGVAAQGKIAASGASLSTVHGTEPLPPGNAADATKRAASNSMSELSGDGPRRSSSRAEAPVQVSSRSEKMDHDVEVDVIGLQRTAVAPPVTGVGTLGLPSSVRSAHSPSQPSTAEAPAGTLPQELESEGIATAQAGQAPGMLSIRERPNTVQRPEQPDAQERRTEEPAAARLGTEGASPPAKQAVSLGRGDVAAAELSAALLSTVPELLPSLPGHHALGAAAAASQAAARSGAVHGIHSQTPLKQGVVGSAQDPSMPAVQATLVCTEVQAVPSTMVEALPPPQAAAAQLTEAAAALAAHDNSQPLNKVLQICQRFTKHLSNGQLPLNCLGPYRSSGHPQIVGERLPLEMLDSQLLEGLPKLSKDFFDTR